jgi:hypothetical protein
VQEFVDDPFLGKENKIDYLFIFVTFLFWTKR